MVRNYNVPSEASLQCPNSDHNPQRVRVTREHIERVHKEKVTFACIVITNGVKCDFSCGTWVGCFNKHQTRKHGQTFDYGADHVYGPALVFS